LPAARHGKTAALAAPFKPKDAELFSIISGFDAAYSAYNGYQAGMERFWTLKYLQQQGITELTATVFKEGPAAASWCAPTTCPWCCPSWARKACRAARGCASSWAPLTRSALDVNGTVIERLDARPSDTAEDDAGEDENRGRPDCHCGGRERTGSRQRR
jgi:exoribonuclease-2